MPGPKCLDPFASPRALIGSELRHARERAGLSQRELGDMLHVSATFIGQLEAGSRRIQAGLACRLDETLGTGGFFERNCKAPGKSKYPDHFAEAAEMEAVATTIKAYDPALIPGLLQTAPYARAVCRAYQPTAPEEYVDQLVAARLERAVILAHPTMPLLWAVLDEAALRREVGSAAVMAEALRHIAALARRNRVIVQVLPFTAGAHASLEGSLKLMAFSDAPPVAYRQGFGTGQLEDDPTIVARCELAYDLVAASALAPPDSLALIESVAEDYAHEEHQL
ncbi:Scr1 family TA system antitoxin-like transcriptional regulator [Streptomyces sp. NPDC059828]|uniref:helix-turn-helix domain-containing protein n=1 Tax=Streptomyces sp. NPDC059828 TaxID=3346965 RepID=UPI00364E49A1